MGGTFDPVHSGHLYLGRQVCVEYGLGRIWYVPTGQPPHKKDHRVTGVTHRCRILELALEKEGGFVSSDFGVRQDEYTYTAQTLALLKEAYPEHEFYFILGANSLYEIKGWYHPELATEAVNVLTASRGYDGGSHRPMEEQIAYLNEKYGDHIQMLHCREVDVSSEEIQEIAARGKPMDICVPEKVTDYIRSHKLYQEGES